MSGLSSFLAQNAKRADIVSTVISKRFINENGEAIPFEIHPISSSEDDVIREASKRVTKVNGKNIVETDFSRYIKKLCAKCVLFPDLNNQELQDSYGVLGGEELITAMLLPGEYNRLIEKVQEVNGFDRSFEELVGEVKN